MTTHNKQASTVRVWDPLIRIFHWSLVLFFIIAFITEDDWLDLHVQAGYALIMLIGFRLVWGLIGTSPARFLNFLKPPSVVIAHLKSMLSRNPKHYLGHNPVAAVMVVALLISILLASFSGLIALAADGQGPLAGTLFSNWRGEWMEEVHEFLANFSLLLVFAHVGGVFLSSLLEGENLARAMFTGRKQRRAHWEDVQQAEMIDEKTV